LGGAQDDAQAKAPSKSRLDRWHDATLAGGFDADQGQ
jgi:hypothetical protein